VTAEVVPLGVAVDDASVQVAPPAATVKETSVETASIAHAAITAGPHEDRSVEAAPPGFSV
jgi:hypothetical protein